MEVQKENLLVDFGGKKINVEQTLIQISHVLNPSPV